MKRYYSEPSPVEINIFDGHFDYQSFLLRWGTALGPGATDNSWNFSFADFNHDGALDLFCVLKANTGGGKTEIHILDEARHFASWLYHGATALPLTGTDSAWTISTGDYNSDGIADLYAINKVATGTGTTEVHVLDGYSNFRSYILQTGTALLRTGTDSSWELIPLPPFMSASKAHILGSTHDFPPIDITIRCCDFHRIRFWLWKAGTYMFASPVFPRHPPFP